MIVKQDCIHFKGYIPCKPHKNNGVHCKNCEYYQPINKKILIIKLGALGDVIRTTPLLERIDQEYPNSIIYWISFSPQLLPYLVGHPMTFTAENIAIVEETNFDIMINLDKDLEACSLAKKISATKKIGYTLHHGAPIPIDKNAEHKYYTGLFDDVSKKNTKSYPEEIFEICGWTFKGEKYQIKKIKSNKSWNISKDKKVIGLNTGCGSRWKTRLWPEDYWVELAKNLQKQDYEVILLGGEYEHERNKRIQQKSGAKYFGHFHLTQFIDLVDQVDLVVTAVTMAMHITIALEKKIVLFNNIFNKNEFELYGLGKILEPPNCACYYANECEKECMSKISVEEVEETIQNLINRH